MGEIYATLPAGCATPTVKALAITYAAIRGSAHHMEQMESTTGGCPLHEAVAREELIIGRETVVDNHRHGRQYGQRAEPTGPREALDSGGQLGCRHQNIPLFFRCVGRCVAPSIVRATPRLANGVLYGALRGSRSSTGGIASAWAAFSLPRGDRILGSFQVTLRPDSSTATRSSTSNVRHGGFNVSAQDEPGSTAMGPWRSE
jgi:hypothetical protein